MKPSIYVTEVEAVRFIGSKIVSQYYTEEVEGVNFSELKEFCPESKIDQGVALVNTMDGWTEVCHGNYVIRLQNGAYCIVNARDFEKNFKARV